MTVDDATTEAGEKFGAVEYIDFSVRYTGKWVRFSRAFYGSNGFEVGYYLYDFEVLTPLTRIDDYYRSHAGIEINGNRFSEITKIGGQDVNQAKH